MHKKTTSFKKEAVIEKGSMGMLLCYKKVNNLLYILKVAKLYKRLANKPMIATITPLTKLNTREAIATVRQVFALFGL